MKSKAIALVVAVALMGLVAGCSAGPIMPRPGDATIESMSNLEYRQKIDALLSPVLGLGQALMGHALDVLNGTVTRQAELAFTETALGEIKKTIDDVDRLVPPATYVSHKAETIAALNQYYDAVRRYAFALQAGEKAEISAGAEGIKAAFTVLETQYGISPR